MIVLWSLMAAAANALNAAQNIFWMLVLLVDLYPMHQNLILN